jgi:hypothetical protein
MDIVEENVKFDNLKNSGTEHEEMEKKLEVVIKKKKQREIEQEAFEKMNIEMIEMDKQDKECVRDFKINNCEIQLFPITSNFRFPKSEMEIVFKILNIENKEFKSSLMFMFSNNIVPIVNGFYQTIEVEGYQDGQQACKSLSHYTLFYERRKSFFENKFFRI